jgi:hypothetical protein
MEESSPPPERRANGRRIACFPAEVERADGAHRPAVIHDLSESGASLLVQTRKIATDDEVTLQLYIFEDADRFHSISGRVVRVEPLAGEGGPWRQRVGVRFSDPLTGFSDEIRRFEELARRLGI